MSLADHADTNDGRGIIVALEALVEQQRIANLIALADHAHARFGNYAGEAGGLGTLFSYGPTPESNMRIQDDIAVALGIGEYAADIRRMEQGT
jgi:hypothetical protein